VFDFAFIDDLGNDTAAIASGPAETYGVVNDEMRNTPRQLARDFDEACNRSGRKIITPPLGADTETSPHRLRTALAADVDKRPSTSALWNDFNARAKSVAATKSWLFSSVVLSPALP